MWERTEVISRVKDERRASTAAARGAEKSASAHQASTIGRKWRKEREKHNIFNTIPQSCHKVTRMKQKAR